MTTLHATNTYNVETTLAKWWKDQLSAITLPAILPAVSYVFNMPEVAMNLPCVSFVHLPISTKKRWQGDTTGTGRGARAANLLDVSVWVSRKVVGWNAQLGFLQAMVNQVHAGASTIQISDYTTNVAAPSAVAYKIDGRDGEWVPTQHDPNPDIERSRFLFRYEWTVRS